MILIRKSLILDSSAKEGLLGLLPNPAASVDDDLMMLY